MAARNAACRSRWTIWVLTGSTRSPRSVRTSASMSGARWLYVPTGPLILPVPISPTAPRGATGRELTSNAQPASSDPNVVGSACDRVGPAHHHRAAPTRARVTRTATSQSTSSSRRGPAVWS